MQSFLNNFKGLLFCAALLSSSGLLAQAEISETPIYSKKKIGIPFGDQRDIVEFNQDAFFIVSCDFVENVRKYSPLVPIEKIDSNGNLLAYARVNIKTDNKRHEIKFVQTLGGKLVILSYLIDKREGQTHFYLSHIEPNTLGQKSDPIKLFSINTTTELNITKNVVVKNSSDGNLIGVVYCNGKTGRLVLVNSNFEIESDKFFSFSFRNFRNAIVESIIDSNGNLYAAGKDTEEEFKIISKKKDHDEVFELECSLEILQNVQFKLAISEENNLNLFGITHSRLKGISKLNSLFISYDKSSSKLLNSVSEKLDPQVLKVSLSKLDSENKEKKILRSTKKSKEVICKDLLLGSQGEAFLTFEYSSRYSIGDYNEGSTGPSSFFYDNQIFALNFSPTGNINWLVKIDKHQKFKASFQKIHGSFFAQQIDGELVIIYNDNQNNIDVQENEPVYSTFETKKEVCLMMAKISADGTVKKKILFDLGKDKLFAVPRASAFQDQNLFLIKCSQGGKHKFILIPKAKI